mgnify:CR=1 FL=1
MRPKKKQPKSKAVKKKTGQFDVKAEASTPVKPQAKEHSVNLFVLPSKMTV